MDKIDANLFIVIIDFQFSGHLESFFGRSIHWQNNLILVIIMRRYGKRNVVDSSFDFLFQTGVLISFFALYEFCCYSKAPQKLIRDMFTAITILCEISLIFNINFKLILNVEIFAYFQKVENFVNINEKYKMTHLLYLQQKYPNNKIY